MRYKLTIEYDGTGLLGWQRQLDGPSVQEYLETVLAALTGETLEIPSAGRTDAGVHALGQVCHIDFNRELPDWKIRDAFNAHLRDLGAPVVVLKVEAADNDFHARFSATGRGYIYRIINRRSPSVLLKDRAWWVPVDLDLEKMRQGSRFLLGHHDFTSFRAAACQAKSPLKTLDKFDITARDEELIFTVEARSFLHHQVRNIKTILEAKDRKAAGPTAPACGLYLAKVMY